VPFETVRVKPINIKFEFSSRTKRKKNLVGYRKKKIQNGGEQKFGNYLNFEGK
jgi:hypothetical protein